VLKLQGFGNLCDHLTPISSEKRDMNPVALQAPALPRSIDQKRAFRGNALIRTLAFPAAILLLLALNMWLSYSFGHARMMYDNPIYRWRESVAIALSKMHDPPAKGYLAYGSVQKYLTEHGLGLMNGEANPLPSWPELRALIYDPERIEGLFRNAETVAVDGSLPPVRIEGNELGLVDYYYWAFKLFGINLVGLWLLYFIILCISILLFFLTFRGSHFCMLLLLFYLSGHAFMVEYANIGGIQTVHNSRVFPVFGLLAPNHMLLLIMRRERLTLAMGLMAAGQTFILCFMIFCRIQATWQALLIVTAGLFAIPYRALWHGLRNRAMFAYGKVIIRLIWPAPVVVAGLVGLSLYAIAIPDALYRATTTTHVFWHPLYDSMISSSPELLKFYSYGTEAYSDEISSYAVRADMRERNDASSPIAYRTDGGIEINLMRNMGAFDAAVRRVFFKVVLEHPFLVLKSFIYDKPRDQLDVLSHHQLYEVKRYWLTILLGFAVVSLYLLMGGALPTIPQAVTAVPIVLLVAVFSSFTTFIVPSDLIVDTILFYLMLLSVLLILLPTALFIVGLKKLFDHAAFQTLRSKTTKWPARVSASSFSTR
jgi:hypothetical protein